MKTLSFRYVAIQRLPICFTRAPRRTYQKLDVKPRARDSQRPKGFRGQLVVGGHRDKMARAVQRKAHTNDWTVTYRRKSRSATQNSNAPNFRAGAGTPAPVPQPTAIAAHRRRKHGKEQRRVGTCARPLLGPRRWPGRKDRQVGCPRWRCLRRNCSGPRSNAPALGFHVHSSCGCQRGIRPGTG